MDAISILRREVKRAGSQGAFAKEAGVSLQIVSDILAGRRKPGPKVLQALGLEKVTTYKRKAKSNA